MIIGNDSKWVFIGDSITDCERARPVGEGLFGANGKGYVSLVDAMLQSTCPEKNIRVVNMGCSGNQVRNLKDRWKTDVIDLKPDWLCILIGINDVWRGFDIPLLTEQHVPPANYESGLEELILSVRPSLAGLVLATPYMIEPNRNDPMRARMDVMGGIVKRLALRHDAVLVDVQAAFDEFLLHRHPMSLAWDRIHPNPTGHMIITKAILNAVGFKW